MAPAAILIVPQPGFAAELFLYLDPIHSRQIFMSLSEWAGEVHNMLSPELRAAYQASDFFLGGRSVAMQ